MQAKRRNESERFWEKKIKNQFPVNFATWWNGIQEKKKKFHSWNSTSKFSIGKISFAQRSLQKSTTGKCEFPELFSVKTISFKITQISVQYRENASIWFQIASVSKIMVGIEDMEIYRKGTKQYWTIWSHKQLRGKN